MTCYTIDNKVGLSACRTMKYPRTSFYVALIFAGISALFLATNIVRGFTRPTKQPPNGQPPAISIDIGGTESPTVAGARTNLGIAAGGANSDIASFSPSGGVLEVTSLKSNGLLRLLISSTAPAACNVTQKSGMYFNDTDKKIYYCDGASWKSI